MSAERDREIIEVLARDVMGWEAREVVDIGPFKHTQIGRLTLWPEDDPHLKKFEGWNPLESWADAGMVAEALAKKFKRVEITLFDHDAGCLIEEGSAYDEHYTVNIDEPTGPRAISLAAYEWAKQNGGKR